MKRNGFVYALMRNGEAVYVGSTVNPISRLNDHSRERGSTFDTIALAYIGSEKQAKEVERLMIFTLKPVQNISCKRWYFSDCLGQALDSLEHAQFVTFTQGEFESDCSVVFDTFTLAQRKKLAELAIQRRRESERRAINHEKLERFCENKKRVCVKMVFKEALCCEGEPTIEQAREIGAFLVEHGFLRKNSGCFGQYGKQKQFIKQEA